MSFFIYLFVPFNASNNYHRSLIMSNNAVEVLVKFTSMLLKSKDVQEIALGRQRGKTTLLKDFIKILSEESPVPVKVLLLAEHVALFNQFDDLKEMVSGNPNIELVVDVATRLMEHIATKGVEANTNENFYIFVDGYNSLIARMIANYYAMANNSFIMSNKDTDIVTVMPKILTFKKPKDSVI